VSQLMGTMVLVPDREPTEVVSFSVLVEAPDGRDAYTCLDIVNRLTAETATSLLHFLHHLCSGTFVSDLYTELWKYDYTKERIPHREVDPVLVTTGTALSQEIFQALQQASGRMGWLHLYTDRRHCIGPAVFGRTKNVRLHYRS
jgi:hypothetical protein